MLFVLLRPQLPGCGLPTEGRVIFPNSKSFDVNVNLIPKTPSQKHTERRSTPYLGTTSHASTGLWPWPTSAAGPAPASCPQSSWASVSSSKLQDNKCQHPGVIDSLIHTLARFHLRIFQLSHGAKWIYIWQKPYMEF